MHRRDPRAVAGDPNESDQALRARLDQRLQRAIRPECLMPVFFFNKIVKLDHVNLIDAQPFQRPIKTFARALASPISGLGREKKALSMLSHPGTDSQL